MAKPKVVDEKRREVVEEEPPKNLIFEYDPESQNRNSVYEFLSNYIEPIVKINEEGNEEITAPLTQQIFARGKTMPFAALIIILIFLLVIAVFQINNLNNIIGNLRSENQRLIDESKNLNSTLQNLMNKSLDSNRYGFLNFSLENASGETKINISSLNRPGEYYVLFKTNRSNQTIGAEGTGLNVTIPVKKEEITSIKLFYKVDGELYEGNNSS